MAGQFEIYKSGDEFRFRLRAGNNEKISSSESYKTRAGVENGIESVRKNAPIDSRYDRRTASNGDPYFVLKAANGEPIGASELYSSKQAMENGIDAVKREAPGAPVDDLT